MKILVCGGRTFTNRNFVFWELDRLALHHKIEQVIVGGAMGADQLGLEWAHSRKIAKTMVPADWRVHGRAAGPIRNQKMLDLKPDLVVAFPGGKGTADMVARSRKAGVEVLELAP